MILLKLNKKTKHIVESIYCAKFAIQLTFDNKLKKIVYFLMERKKSFLDYLSNKIRINKTTVIIIFYAAIFLKIHKKKLR